MLCVTRMIVNIHMYVPLNVSVDIFALVKSLWPLRRVSNAEFGDSFENDNRSELKPWWIKIREWQYREMFYNIEEQSLERENSKMNFC